ncbi:MAG TPA: formate dehydrogenase subunit gamma [Xanthobacteraceae bacterium]|nr:formate dehydrogenase subunit gamma [Xanthobacteraceae bacterium]
MTTLVARLRLVFASLALAGLVSLAPAALAQQPSSVNPTANSVNEDKLLQQFRRIEGRGSIPDVKSYVVEQPEGRNWRQFHEVTLRWIGAVAILGMLALLIVFYAIRGTIKIEGGRSGRAITRFNGVERFTHWLTAGSFVILALTGLNITFGKPLLLPLMGPEAFSKFSVAAKYVHDYLSFPFVLGLILIFVLWVRDNVPGLIDLEWLKKAGGFFGHDHPPARRFNAGQKAVFWVVILTGAAVTVSGYYLIFPFYAAGIAGMQIAEIIHGVLAMLFVAAMLAHIYIGTLGMEGAFDAMGSGEVDLNWAKEHHSLWVEKEQGRATAAPPHPTPAE